MQRIARRVPRAARNPLLPLTLLITAATAAGAAKTHRVEGLIIEVDRAQGLLVVSHKPVPGLMPAMVMPFRADPPRQLDSLRPGTQITFDLGPGSNKARNIRVLKVDVEFTIPKPPNQLNPGDPVPDFTLTDQLDRTVRLSQFRGRTVLIQFLYTRCPLPDVCPRLASQFAYLHREFGDRLTLLSVTLDPQHDTPAVLRDYANRWKASPENWRFLTGPEDSIRSIGGLFGVVFWPEDGVITHTAATAIIDPAGNLQALIEGSSYRAGQLRDLVQRQLR